MLDHQAAVLDDFDAAAGEIFRRGVIADAGLKPNGRRFFFEDIFDVRADVVGPTKYIDQIDFARYIGEPAINRPAENFSYVGEIDRNGNDIEAGLREILRHIERRLKRLLLGFNAEHRDAATLRDYFAYCGGCFDQVISPAHGLS